MIQILRSIIAEYGIVWTLNRSLYYIKLKIMKIFPFTEKFYEKRVNIKRINIFDFNLESIHEFLINLDDKKKESIIKVADNAIKGIIKSFSSIDLDFGVPINWQLNPLTGFENKKELKWHMIPDFDSKVGDIKVIWEASRFTHFLYFVRAFLITKNEKYYNAFSAQMKGWIEDNPYSYGSNHKCGQEATLRMLNVLIVYSVFSKFGLTTNQDKNNVMHIVEGSYKKIMANFFYAHKCIKNNHTFTEILGLIVGAWCSNNEIAVKKAYKLMDKEIRRQFLADGGFTQYSFNYHRFTLQIIECLYKVSEKTEIYITETARLKNSVLLLYQVQEENGDLPNYGSNDGALIFPLSSCGYRDFRPVINTMYGLLEGRRLYEFGDYDEELLWFGNSRNLPLEKVKRTSVAFNNSGFYTLRHKDGFLMTCLQNYKSRPAHMDQLHIDVWHKGINIFCDTGTYSYASELGKELSSTAGHNTIKLNNIEQMNKRGAFLVMNWTKQERVEYSRKAFIGKILSKNGYTHQRKISQTNRGYMIEDEVIGDCDFFEIILNTPCKAKLIKNGFEIYNGTNRLATIKSKGDIKIEEVFRSTIYLQKERINCVKIKSKIRNERCKNSFEIILN